MQFPLSLLSNGCRFEVFGVDPSESHSQREEIVSVALHDYRGRYTSDLKLPAAFLLQVADMIYRLTGRAPQSQQVRVEVVAVSPATAPAAAAASEAPPRPRLQLVDDHPAGDQVDTIRARMLSGK